MGVSRAFVGIYYIVLRNYSLIMGVSRVSVGDSAGVVLDGANEGDLDFTDEITAVTARFYGFSSETCGGVVSYVWAVGVGHEGPSRESVLAFTPRGVTNNGDGSGHAQLPLPGLRDLANQRLYITVRGVTGCSGILESTSNGFIIDHTPPSLDVIATGTQAIERAQSGGVADSHVTYQSTDTYSSVWTSSDDESGLVPNDDDVIVQVGTFPGGSDVMQSETVSGGHLRGRVSAGADSAVVEGVPVYVTVTATNGAGLQTTSVSEPVVMDTTPPLSGEVR